MAKTVLLVDDCEAALDVLEEDLGAAGFRVLRASDGVDGWERFRADRPDLVVTDVRMPRWNGFQLLERIRDESATPVIVLTAWADADYVRIARERGADALLQFPRDVDRLVALARQLSGLGRPDGSAADDDDAPLTSAV
jgi:DNA-binding response OmpR family regulator